VFDNIRMVMVNTSHPGNIGGSARAMKNMGLSRLVLIDPKEYPSEHAISRAASALDVIDKIQVLDNLDDAIADCSLVIGTSARERRIPWPLLTPRECGDRVWAESKKHQVAILFGREDRGLTNDELQKCHFHVHIPANPEYSSLNISCALQVIAYEIRMSALNEENGGPLHYDDWDIPPAKQSDMELYYEHLQETLEKLNFIDPDNPRQALNRLRRLYNRIRMDQMELGMLRGMLTAIQNYVFHSDKRQATLQDRIIELEAELKSRR
jgi:tRNA (cytidine32/uridine32-2'-O)-methyltransferase